MKEIKVQSESGDLTLRKSNKLVGLRKNQEEKEVDAVETNVIQDLGGFQVVSLRQDKNIDDALDEVRQDESVDVGTHVYFVDGDNRPVVPTGIIYCHLAEGVGKEESQVIFDTFALEVLEQREDGTCVLQVTPNSPNPLKVAAALQKLSMVAKAVPDLDVPLDQYFVEPRDGLLSHQWHLQNNGRVADVPNFPLKPGADAKVRAAWRRLGSLGSSSITVAVIDNGFDLNHPDLRGKTRINAQGQLV